MRYLPLDEGGNLTKHAFAKQKIDISKIDASIRYTTLGISFREEYPKWGLNV